MRQLRMFRAVAFSAFQDGVRQRLFLLFGVFAFTAIYSSVLAGVMAVDQEGRVLADFGLALMELTALVYALFAASSVLIREAETKTIYLVFSRPVPRWAYLGGKLGGTLMTAALMLLVMAAMHLTLLAVRGYGIPACYGWALAGSFLKLSVITSLAFFVSLFSTSAVSTLVISGILWTAGHFVSEVRFLAGQAHGAAALALKTGLWLLPNLQLFNARDAAGAACALGPAAFGAAAAWTLGAFLGALWLLSGKEF
ncbi:MAG: ABC transporter permease [Elusimicrobia bacterium]|nr:ABC transporter permease [Elusimicrobiota bacterium]